MKRPTSLVVGAAGGVGLELVTQLLAAGHRVIGTVQNDAEAELVERQVTGVRLARIDLADADTVAPALQPVLDELPDGLDHVAVCAAISPYGPLETTPLAALRRTFEINTLAGLAIYQVSLPHLRRSRGRLALISSFAGKVAIPFIGHYSASKFALEALADVMRREAAAWGVRVIVVEPGGIKTSMVTNQIVSIRRDRVNLSSVERELYGSYFDRFETVLRQGSETGMQPSLVAGLVVEALQATAPKARYQIGADAQYLCNVAARLPDEELDVVASGFFAERN